LEELAFLANVLVAGATIDDQRFRPAEAAEAALATVAVGAELAARVSTTKKPSVHDLASALATTSADALFRAASAALTRRSRGAASYVRDRSEIDAALRSIKS
jgi:hypothetical protein